MSGPLQAWRRVIKQLAIAERANHEMRCGTSPQMRDAAVEEYSIAMDAIFTALVQLKSDGAMTDITFYTALRNGGRPL